MLKAWSGPQPTTALVSAGAFASIQQGCNRSLPGRGKERESKGDPGVSITPASLRWLQSTRDSIGNLIPDKTSKFRGWKCVLSGVGQDIWPAQCTALSHAGKNKNTLSLND